MKDKTYNYNLIACEKIITEKDLSNGNLILLASRPGIGKTKTCCNLFEYYSKSYSCLYFDLSSSASSYFLGNKEQSGLIFDFTPSVEMIKKIQNGIKYDNLKIVFIDYWQLLTNTDNWFLKMLLELCYNHKIVIIITSQLSRNKGLGKIKNIFYACRKCVVITCPYAYGESEKYELVYLLYKSN